MSICIQTQHSANTKKPTLPFARETLLFS